MSGDGQKKAMTKSSRKRRPAVTVIESILILVFSFSVVFLGINFFFDMKSERKMDDIRTRVKASRLQFEKIEIPEEEKEKRLQLCHDSILDAYQQWKKNGSMWEVDHGISNTSSGKNC